MYPHSEEHGHEGFGSSTSTAGFVDPRTQLHEGLGRFMAGVFAWMGAGLAITAIVAFFASTSETYLGLLYHLEYFQTSHGVELLPAGFTGLGFVVLFAPLLVVWGIGSRIRNMDPPVASATFLVFSAMIGASLGHIPLQYGLGSLSSIFAITAGMFAALAGIGFVTKKDLSAMGRFLLMAVIGLILAGIVSFFVPGMSIMLAVITVLVFAGLTAYDTQKIKQTYLVHGAAGNVAIIGALELYLDFINMFLALLRLFGNRD